MGKTYIRLVKKIAPVEPVYPKVGSDGFQQPPYGRAPSAVQTSKTLKTFHSCVAMKMREASEKQGGFEGKGRIAVQKAFSEAAKACKIH